MKVLHQLPEGIEPSLQVRLRCFCRCWGSHPRCCIAAKTLAPRKVSVGGFPPRRGELSDFVDALSSRSFSERSIFRLRGN
jgi:hypothetical protein